MAFKDIAIIIRCSQMYRLEKRERKSVYFGISYTEQTLLYIYQSLLTMDVSGYLLPLMERRKAFAEPKLR